MSRTVDALVARGFDTHLASKLYEAGETLRSLQQKSEPKLAELGLLPTQIESILDSQRPSVPIPCVHQLLYESRRACVICRGRNKSIILHHIEPWAQSRSHDESNLVVLCSLCRARHKLHYAGFPIMPGRAALSTVTRSPDPA